MSELVAFTRVRFEDKCFDVSTINRGSSAMLDHGRGYAETMVFAFDREAQKRWEILYKDQDIKDSIRTHFQIVERIRTTGNPDQQENGAGLGEPP